MSIKRILAASGAIGLLGALAFAVPASAAGVKMVCTTQGVVKTNPPVGVQENKGGYTYSDLTFVCTGVEKLTDPFVVQFNVRSEGVYKNLICGTGKAMSTRNVLEGQTVVLGDPKTNFNALAPLMKYTIEFLGFSGELYWHDPAVHKVSTGKPGSGTPLDPKPHNDKDYGFGGSVEIVPDLLVKFPFPPEPCTKAFQVTAVLTVDTEPLPV